MANPSGKKLAREAGRVQMGEFAKQIELSFPNDVDWIWDREIVSEVFVLDLLFRTWCMLIPMIRRIVVW